MTTIENVFTDSECVLRATYNSLRVFATEDEMYEEMGYDMIVGENEPTPAGDNLIWCYSEDDDNKQCYLLNL